MNFKIRKEDEEYLILLIIKNTKNKKKIYIYNTYSQIKRLEC